MHPYYIQTMLSLAALSGHRDMVQLLVEKGADVTATVGVRCVGLMRGSSAPRKAGCGYKTTAVTLAARFGHRGVVELLVEKGADVTTPDWVSVSSQSPPVPCPPLAEHSPSGWNDGGAGGGLWWSL